MENAAADVANLMKQLSNQNRLLILCQLIEGEKSVGHLAELVGASQVTVSQQLAPLRSNGLVKSRREAQTIYYSLAQENIRYLIEFLYQTFCPAKASSDSDSGRKVNVAV